MKVRTAIILCGGLGTRLREVTSSVPKPMVLINKRPFLEYLMDYWINQGIYNFIISVGYLKDSIINHFGTKYNGANIRYVSENIPLGTGGALLLASEDLNDTFLVINGDTFSEINLNNFYNYHLKKQSIWTIALFKTRDASRYTGFNVNTNGQISSVVKKNKKSYTLANAGAYLIEPKMLHLKSYSKGIMISLENEMIPDFLKSNEVLFGKEFLGKFIDIGIPEDLINAEKILLKSKNIFTKNSKK